MSSVTKHEARALYAPLPRRFRSQLHFLRGTPLKAESLKLLASPQRIH